ncbi:uncharacterized protein CC84DRAFT_350036 [Paraphaeosphaeria sporulosa]|uniref:Uncharacterized protein n=1 Tax=Paraphaeosphaeria sporulosa TaxID=1460663 RepID=A0A177BWR7_9PLEO|nr:uncharacterized protein CC84DRAFT_350036 [Paraphaeosphaeria sporulosa]OAF99933.1 hypothetical protein CC84DRAFT_350036 [Paraphaeosphaeria sporulosa]
MRRHERRSRRALHARAVSMLGPLEWLAVVANMIQCVQNVVCRAGLECAVAIQYPQPPSCCPTHDPQYAIPCA